MTSAPATASSSDSSRSSDGTPEASWSSAAVNSLPITEAISSNALVPPVSGRRRPDRRTDRIGNLEGPNGSIGTLTALGADEADDLVEEEGIAIRRPVQGGRGLPIGRELADTPDELGNLVDTEPAERNRGSLTTDLSEQRRMSLGLAELGLPVGGDDQRAGMRQLPCEKS